MEPSLRSMKRLTTPLKSERVESQLMRLTWSIALRPATMPTRTAQVTQIT